MTSIARADVTELSDAIAASLSKTLCNVVLVLFPNGAESPNKRLDELRGLCTTFSQLPEYSSAQVLLQMSPVNGRRSAAFANDLAFTIYHRLEGSQATLGRRDVVGQHSATFEPAFTLPPARRGRTSRFGVTWPAPNADPLNTGRSLHIAYTVHRDVVAYMIIDQYGEGWKLSSIPNTGGVSWVSELWSAIQAYSSNAAIEWRFTVVKSGLYTHDELQGMSTPCVFIHLALIFDCIRSLEDDAFHEYGAFNAT